MTLSSTNVAVIGVGPNGLSVAAHLRQAGVEYQAFGRPMGAWRFNMPAGMRLKSEPYASDLSAPQSGFLARDYCSQANEVYHDRVIPLSREQFIDYGTWFADELVPDIDETEIVSLSKQPGGGFMLRTANDESMKAAQVVVATGIIPFAYIPPELSGLPLGLGVPFVGSPGSGALPWQGSLDRRRGFLGPRDCSTAPRAGNVGQDDRARQRGVVAGSQPGKPDSAGAVPEARGPALRGVDLLGIRPLARCLQTSAEGNPGRKELGLPRSSRRLVAKRASRRQGADAFRPPDSRSHRSPAIESSSA